MAQKNKPLVLRDEIHGDISFDRVLRCVVDHPYFQRLRYIKQLGLAEYVFPCATHTRFQHSLGAAYLAMQYFESVVLSWVRSPFPFQGKSESTQFLSEKTYQTCRSVWEERASYEFWSQVVGMSGMLHDVGHGPWSHSFENLELPQDFESVIKNLSGSVRAYFDGLRGAGKKLKHEDISVLYISEIFREMRGTIPDAERYFLPVAAMVNRKMVSPAVENELADHLLGRKLRGGVEMHRLLRPLISGPFDVDRIDYIQRDGRNCGVSIGGIEWRRIMAKLTPCLAEHQNDRGEPPEVILISHMKNQHVLDDFVFSLFQMYAQVYMHPKIVGLEEEIRRLLAERVPSKAKFTVTFDTHRSLSDESFRQMLSRELGVPEINETLMRKNGFQFKIAFLPDGAVPEAELSRRRYSPIDPQDRPMLKDSVGLFLYNTLESPLASATPEDLLILPWNKVSPVAQHFRGINYSPRIWIRREAESPSN